MTLDTYMSKIIQSDLNFDIFMDP
ncbi:TPA: hypothetical protein ANIA_11629 [Aspergillus nidulans FGSC A4]|uniref:Uncharacterized protein n=1 Tax=Emericella nidulans (strain FGSC A4 / ATCC 38163 / CBS 112.46 / NRRL 194 / M139) TaxID=227321 RepID=C8VA08_EMENI|nr:TPA: hypothetical protein ANIA_11629 [Aspergillus nidulans FGSC A4]